MTARDPLLEAAVVKAAKSYIDNPDVSTLHALKWHIANLQDPSPDMPSAWSVARQLVEDCKNSRGEFYEAGLIDGISEILVRLYQAQGRLPLYRNVTTGEVHEQPAKRPSCSET